MGLCVVAIRPANSPDMSSFLTSVAQLLCVRRDSRRNKRSWDHTGNMLVDLCSIRYPRLRVAREPGSFRTAVGSSRLDGRRQIELMAQFER